MMHLYLLHEERMSSINVGLKDNYNNWHGWVLTFLGFILYDIKNGESARRRSIYSTIDKEINMT